MTKTKGAAARRAKTLATTVVVCVPLVVTGSALAGNPHGTAPGQAKQEQQAAAPETKHADSGKRNHGAGRTAPKAAKTPKTAKAPKTATAPKTAKAPKTVAPKSNGPAGKTTICHATGSETNPYVTITISDHALPAHDRHQNDEDIIPAPGGGCPSAPAAKGQDKPAAAHANGHEKVTICHATGSDTNPFVEITIAAPAVAAHDRHQNDEDVIPAPAEGCPGPATTTRTTPALPGLGQLNGPSAAGQQNGPSAAVLGESVSGGPVNVRGVGLPAGGPADTGDVLGETTGGGPATIRESGADAPAAASGSSLPFTGLDLALVIALGLGALLGGIALRRSIATRRTTA
jgi:hypothetical protein